MIHRQPKGTLNFLLKTSILERLCGSLCDAVTGDFEGQAILEELEDANLFIIPLDNESRWYRYHRLFAEVSQARLRKNHQNSPRNCIGAPAPGLNKQGRSTRSPARTRSARYRAGG